MHRLFALCLMLAPVAAQAQQQQEGRARTYGLGTLVSNAGMDATRTAVIDLQAERSGYDIAKLTVAHTNAAGALSIVMTCYEDTSASSATTVVLQDCVVASGACTSYDATWTKAVTGSKQWVWRVDISGYSGQVNCTFAASGAGATDKITVTGQLSTK